MRLFVAVPLPEKLRDKMGALAKEMKMDGIVPIKAENMHITLKFIGETNKENAIEQELQRVQVRTFDCTAKGVGVFPNENYVRVVWVGIESMGELEKLAKEVQATLRVFGGDDKFSAHITIARVRKKVDLQEFLRKYNEEELGRFTVSGLELIESILQPGGSKYTTLAKYKATI